MRSLIWTLLFLAVFDCLGLAQTVQPEAPIVELSLLKSTELPIATNGVSASPVACDSTAIYFPSFGSSGLDGLNVVSRDGQTRLISKASITDIENPILGRPFVTESDVYIRGHADYGEHEATFKTPDGKEIKGTAVTETKWFIAQFKPDGKYVRLIRLDLPFDPQQIGAFPSGGFLVAGVDRKIRPNEPRVALLRPDGLLDRFLDLKDDLRSDSPEFSQPGSERDFITPRNLSMAVILSEIVRDGPNLMLVRRGTQRPLYSVSAGGEVRSLEIRGPEGYVLQSALSMPTELLAVYSRRRTDGPGMEFAIVAFDRATLRRTQQYSYPRQWGMPLSCMDGPSLSFLRTDKGKLVLLTAALPR